MAEVVLENVSKIFPNGVRAVTDLNLTVPDGERVVLVGPSGSGKTTVLRVIAGLESPTTGRVWIAGREVTKVPPRDRDVAMVFQRPTFYPHLSVRDNLAFGFYLRNEPGRWVRWLNRLFRPARHAQSARFSQELTERVIEAARLLELEDVLDRSPRQLSGGQQQRVALGRALVRRPAAFLLDEPLSNLEPRLRADLRRELHLLQRRLPATMIYVTHDQTEALTFGDRIVILDRGVVQQVGRPAVLYEQPRNRFVAGFIGWPPMNFISGRLECDDGRGRFVRDDWFLALAAEHALHYDKGTPVVLGVRPEHVTRVQAPEAGRSLAMTVAMVEPLGGEVLLTCRRGDVHVTVKVPSSHGARPGEDVELVFDMRYAHWFDEKGQAQRAPEG